MAVRRGRLVRLAVHQHMAFLVAGLVTVALSLEAPGLSNVSSLAWHVSGHALLVLVAPPLLLLGIPRALAWDAIPTPRRARAVRMLTHPVFAAITSEVVVLGLHVPSFYTPLQHSVGWHTLEHLLLLVMGLLFWWPVVEPLPVWSRYGWVWKIVYLFISRIPMLLLGVVLLFSHSLLYQRDAFLGRAVSDGIREQQLTGAMIVLATTVVLAVALGAIVIPRLARASGE